MPIYEYRCQNCRKYVVLRLSYAEYDTAKKQCSHCGSEQLTRLVSRVRVVRSEEARLDSLSDPTSFGDVDENDPKSIGKFMRRMSNEMGEDLGGEFDEVVGRLESGEDPEAIEKDYPDLGLGDASGMGAGMPGGFGDDF